MKVIIIADSWTAFKDTLLVAKFDRGVSEAEIELIDKKLKSDDIRGETNLEQEAGNQRELLLMMKRYNIMGLLEYFFSPIIFPAILSLWVLVMLVIQVFC